MLITHLYYSQQPANPGLRSPEALPASNVDNGLDQDCGREAAGLASAVVKKSCDVRPQLVYQDRSLGGTLLELLVRRQGQHCLAAMHMVDQRRA